MRQVAQYADAANLVPAASMGPMSPLSPEDVRRKLSVLEQYCRDVDRPFSSVLVTHSAQPVIIADTRERVAEKLNDIPEPMRARFQAMGIMGTPDEVTRAYQDLIDLGLNYFVTGVRGNDLETLELLGTQVIPNLVSTGGIQQAIVA